VSKPAKTSQPLTVSPVYLAASAINNLVGGLPAGTASFSGIVLITLFTGQLVPHPGGLARAALPYVLHLRWGWHRVGRAMERGKGAWEARFDRAVTWGLARVPVEPVRLGREHRTVQAVDTSTVVRLRAKLTRSALVGKGDCPRAQRAAQANMVAALTTLVLIGGVRVGWVRRTRWGLPCQGAVASIFADLPTSTAKRLFSGDAGLATLEQFRTATEHEALGGRLRKNVTLRRAPPPQRPSKRGRPALQGPGLHPGAKRPEGRPDEDTTLRIEDRAVRVRRWPNLHFRETPQTAIEVVRVADPADKRPLLIGTTARELTTAEVRLA
jgi:hypothetical protein